ncbi:MAG TPA: DegT/DnrJ/EryC1/StrS family aminotransferase, partial [Kofleriaceae bacterium]
MSKIPLVDLKAQYESIKAEIDPAIQHVIATTAFVGGPAVKDFETKFTAFCDGARAVSCGNGTDAIHIVLHALGVGPGDEVITVPYTFIATAEAISMTGAKPVFVDVRDDGLIDPSKVAAVRTAKTKAIIPVHLYGQAADIDAVRAAAPGLPILEDAAQAHGAKLRGKRVGSLGTAATFSFFPGKNLGAYGDGGAMTFTDAELAKRCEMLRDHGRTDKYLHELPGFNSRLDTIQAAVLSVKLAHLDAWNAARRRIAGWYLERLAGIPELGLPSPAADTESVWHLFVVHHARREHLRRALDEAGIASGIHYPIPLHLQPAYRSLGHASGAFPVSERLANTCLSLPMYPELTEAA